MFLVQQDEGLVHLVEETTHGEEKEDIAKIHSLILSHGKAVVFNEAL